MIKINAAWFNRTERGTFAGIFGLMIQLGQVAINKLAPILLAGFTIGTFVVRRQLALAVSRAAHYHGRHGGAGADFPKETPEQAGSGVDPR